MELTRTAPPPLENYAATRHSRRHWLALGLLLIVAAIVAPALLLGWRSARAFRVGPALLMAAGVDIGAGGRFGPLAVRQGHHYQFALRAEGAPSFAARLEYQDGTGSKRYETRLFLDGNVHALDVVVRARRDDPAATLVVEPEPAADPSALRLGRLDIYEISASHYVWRAVVRLASLCVLLAGMSVFGRQCYLRWHDPPEGHAAHASRRVALWAALLLTVATGFGLFVLQDRHSLLFQDPPTPSIYGWDGSFYYYWLRSAMVEGDVDFAKDLRDCNSMPAALRDDTLLHSPRTPRGLLPNKYPIGWALFELPWYAGADVAARLAGVPRDGWGPLYQVFLVAGQVAYAVAGLWLAYRLLAGGLPPACAAAGVALGWLCSPLAYYQTLIVSMAHNVLFFAVVCAYAAALDLRRNPDRLRPWLLVGIFCALAILSRYQAAVLLLFPGVVCLQAVWQAPRRWTRLAAGVAASAVPLAVQACAWRALYGSFFLYTYEGEGFDWGHPHLWESLFSPYHGLFNWHPALLAGFAGFVGWAVTTPRRTEAACFAASLGLTIYVNSAWQCWWFGDSFGGRAYDGCTLFAMLGFGWTLHALARRRVALHAAAAAGLVTALWSMNLLWLSASGLLPLTRPVPWQEKLAMTRSFWFPGR